MEEYSLTKMYKAVFENENDFVVVFGNMFR